MEKEVDDIYDEFEQMRDRDLVTLDILHGAASQLSDTNRLVDDWREMRGLLERLIAVRSIDELPEAMEVWSDVVDMLEATSDDQRRPPRPVPCSYHGRPLDKEMNLC